RSAATCRRPTRGRRRFIPQTLTPVPMRPGASGRVRTRVPSSSTDQTRTTRRGLTMNRQTHRTGPRAMRLAMLPAALAMAMCALPAAAQDAARTCPTPEDPDAPCPANAPGAVELDQIVVRGMRASLMNALELKQGSMQIVDAIVAEDIGKFP